MSRQARIALFSMLLLLAASAVSAEGVAVYHSPDDSGVNLGTIAIPSGGVSTLHLYMDGGAVSSVALDPCCAGLGDEILGWDFELGAADGLTITSVLPVGDVVVNQTAILLSMNGGDFQKGDLGPTKLADIEVQTTGDGSLSLVFGQTVGPLLDLQDVNPAAIITVPEPSTELFLLFGTAVLAGLKRRRRQLDFPEM